MATLEENLMHIKKWGALAAAALLIFLIFFKGLLVNIPPGTVGVLFNSAKGGTQLNEFNGGKEGWGVKIPVMQSIKLISTRAQTLERAGEQALTAADNKGIQFRWEVIVGYRIDREQAAELYAARGSEKEIADMVLTALNGMGAEIFGNYSQEDLPRHIQDIAPGLRAGLQERIDSEAKNSNSLRPGFVSIESADIVNIKFNDQIMNAITGAQQRMHEAEKERYTLEIVKSLNDQAIIEAERAKQEVILKAEGEAQALLRTADAKAKGLQMVKDAYQNMPDPYIQIKYIEALKANAEKGNLLILDCGKLDGDLVKILNINELITSKSGGEATSSQTGPVVIPIT